MAQSKSATKMSDAEAQQLSDQITALKGDIASISQTLTDMGSARRDAVVSEASDKVAHLRKRGEQGLQEAQAKAEELADRATESVRKQPAAAMGIAVGLGFALGYLTGRK